MFKRSDKKKPTETQFYELIITPRLKEILQINDSSPGEPSSPNEQQLLALETYLQKVTTAIPIKKKILKELATFHLRSLQLQETKDVVYSLRETDKTSDEALDYLKDKMDQLIEEQENLIMKFLTLEEELKSTPVAEFAQKINAMVISIEFINTNVWEEDLDYYRTRFLMQREQEEDQERKDKYRPLEDKVSSVYRDPLAKPKAEEKVKLNKPSVKIILPKSSAKKLVPLINSFNKLLNELPEAQQAELLELDESNIQLKLTEQEQQNFETGKELYALKREQGILTLKTYEIVQTLKSRLLNITGSIASRSFLGNGFKDLLQSANNSQLTEEQKRTAIIQTITRLLRILGELKPGEELKK